MIVLKSKSNLFQPHINCAVFYFKPENIKSDICCISMGSMVYLDRNEKDGKNYEKAKAK